MYQTLTLAGTGPYASRLNDVRLEFAKGRAEMPGMSATDPDARWMGWLAVARFLEWSITDDVSQGRVRPVDVDLWRRVRDRMRSLSAAGARSTR